MEEINTRGAYGVEHTVVPSGEDLQYLLTVQKADMDLFPSLGGLSLCDQILPRTLTISLLFPVSPQNLIVMVFTSLSEESHLIYTQLTLVLEQINTCFVVNAGLSLSSPESFPQICAVLKNTPEKNYSESGFRSLNQHQFLSRVEPSSLFASS